MAKKKNISEPTRGEKVPDQKKRSRDHREPYQGRKSWEPVATAPLPRNGVERVNMMREIPECPD
jgi:hypothetical protein